MLAAYYEREGKLAIAEIHRRAVQRIELAIEEAALMQQGGLGMEPPPAPSNPP